MLNKKMRVLAFDQSTAKTGYAVFSGSDLVKWGLINYSADSDKNSRIEKMALAIDDLIKAQSPDIVVFEGVSLKTSIQVVILLAQLQGCLMQSCYLQGKQFLVYEPASWRKMLDFKQGGKVKREELKEQAITFVRQGYGITVGEDVCEAICIGIAFLRNHDMLPDINKLTMK